MEIRRVPASSGSRERRLRSNSHQGGKEARCPTHHEERTIQERGSQVCGTAWRLGRETARGLGACWNLGRGSFTGEERLKPDVGLGERKGGKEFVIVSTDNSLEMFY